MHIPQCFFPSAYEAYLTADDIYNNGTHYVKCHADTLYYTGYDYTRGVSTKVIIITPLKMTYVHFISYQKIL